VGFGAFDECLSHGNGVLSSWYMADGEGGHWDFEGANGFKPVCNCQVSGGHIQDRVTSQLQEDSLCAASQLDEAG